MVSNLFRAAIKEPEELAYLFLCIAIGLGMGANQWKITLLAYGLILVTLWCLKLMQKKDELPNLWLTVHAKKTKKISLDSIVEVLKGTCEKVQMKRFDQHEKHLEATFVIECSDYDHFTQCQSDLESLDPSLQLTFLDQKGIS